MRVSKKKDGPRKKNSRVGQVFSGGRIVPGLYASTYAQKKRVYKYYINIFSTA
jgi:hypothetical protein